MHRKRAIDKETWFSEVARRGGTLEVSDAAGELGDSDCAILVWVTRTTTASTSGENYDPDVTGDLERAWAAAVPSVRFDRPGVDGNA